MMMVEKVLLKYSTDKAEKPILASVIRKTDVPMNILHADLSTEGGEIFISIDASEGKTSEVINLFKEHGLEIEEIKEAIHLDEDSCIECGACVSICPTDALKLDDDFSLILDEDKCVYCKACVPACPVRALNVRKL
ncbi:MAG: 4Fe-4S binding protein [Hadesarchaea archaeon]|nr:4Fe-4S binding protein [Hadesarchaea archaeon]